MHKPKRFLAGLLALVLIFGCVGPVHAVEAAPAGEPETTQQSLRFREVDGSQVQGLEQNAGEAPSTYSMGREDSTEPSEPYTDDTVVRVSVVLEKPSTLEAGFPADGIADNEEAMAYRRSLKEEQNKLLPRIRELAGDKFELVHQLTLAANLISVNVPYGTLEDIRALEGVADVEIETEYTPDFGETAAEPNMSTSSSMIGSSSAWAAGYTGAGTRIAVIDTGIDTDHQSFSSAGYEYSLEKLAAAKGMALEEYEDSIHMLTQEEVASKLELLNIADNTGVEADRLYLGTKVPFAYNYVDKGFDVTHDNDSATEHGSHVAGIAAANRYIPKEDGSFANALDAVYVQGVAPDAQILVMKVFGKNGGANDSDYMAAIEDAIILGADAINLSLGSSNPGFSRSYKYQSVMDALQDSGVVVTISAGNAGHWAEYSNNGTGLLYGDDVSFATNGSPGSYTNAFTVASADNTGTTTQYIGVNDNQDKIFYVQSLGYGNEDLVTLAGSRDYVLIDGVGTQEQFDALGDDVLKGKIAVCSRGDNAFTEKAANALAHGAVALVVYNNAEGSFGMNLTGYGYTAPCVAITRQEGELLRSAATAVTDGEGNTLYYQGTMTVSDNPVVVPGAADAPVTMSSFSSWGVPGSLELKPEITAPGGNIYSVNGAVQGGKAYENMSGTSMAAPQVAGLAALAAQYIRDCGIPEGSDFTARQLAQSLLMSTAKPVTDNENGGYYSVMKQGAGLADISKVLSARSYVTMGSDATKSWADGKVKAELGDDPQRTGSYTFSFDLRNITEENQKFVLSADLFTQAMTEIDGTDYLDTATADLAFLAGWTVDGAAVETDPALLHMDFNGDGAVNEKDAEAILDLVTGKRDTLHDQENADLNGDGKITAYDAHLFLVKLSDSPIQVAAGKTAHVTVTLRLTDSQKAALDERYVNGAYIEGFVFATELSNAEGVEGTVHSIPVLGFYGNWSDPSMYDKGTYAMRFYGDETLPYTGELYTNSFLYMAPGDKTYKNELGNPYLEEETYPQEKVAIRSTDIIYGYGLSLIRNPAALVLTVEDLSANEMLYCTPPAIEAFAAYYQTSTGAWAGTYGEGYVNQSVASLGAKEGDRIRVSVVSIPEYYETAGNLTKDEIVELIQSGKLGKGATLSTDLWVDDTAPTMTGIVKDLATGDLTVTVQDNQYVAAVAILNARGTKIYTYSGVEQSEMGTETSATFDLSDLTIGQECLVEVCDYAGNERYYTVNYGGAPEDYTGKMYGFTNSVKRGGDKDDASKNPRWMSFDPATLWYDSVTLQYGGSQIEAHVDYNVTAAEYVDGYVYMAASDGYFYAAPHAEWEYARKVGRYDIVTKEIRDMAFNTADKKLYALDASNTVYTVDLVTGALTKQYTVSIQHPISNAARYKPLETLAIDDNGTFYSVCYGAAGTTVYGQEYPCYSYLFSWTNGQAVDGKIENVTCVGGEQNHGTGYTSSNYTQSMAWDHDADVLYWANATNATGSTTSFLLKFDLSNGAAERVNTTYTTDSEGVEHELRMASKTFINIAGLYVVPGGSSVVGPMEQALDITISESEKTLLKNSSFTLTTEVFPWNLKDYSVSWSTSNGAVATVENGVVHAVGAGEAVITATTNAAPHLTAECRVTVKELPDTKLSAVIFAADNNPYWAEFNAPEPAGWTAVSGVTGNFFGGTMVDGTIYVTDGSAFYAVDPDTFESTLLQSDVEGWAWSDACPSPKSQGVSFGTIATACQQGQCFNLVDPEAGMITWYWDMSQAFSSDPLAVVAHHRSGTYSYSYITDVPANYYYAMSEGGELWEFVVYTQDEGSTFSLAIADLGNVGLELTGVSKRSGSYASMYYDEASGYLLVSAYLNGSEAKLYAVDLDNMLTAEVGGFGENVWPVAGLYQYDRIQDLTVLLKPESMKLDAKDTAQLEAKVRPATFTGGITWTSSDPSVATVDENGLVTAVAQGTAVITAASVDADTNGNHATAECTVEVKDLADVDAVVKAQLIDKNGAYWAEINTKTLEVNRLADASAVFYAGGASDGVIYGSTCNFKDNGKLYTVDPANGYAETKGGDCIPDYAPIDMADAPLGRAVYQADNEGGTIVKEVFGFPALLTYYQDTALLSDYTTGELTRAGSFSTAYYYNKLAAIAYIGGGSNDQGYPYRSYMVLEADGHLHKFTITADYYYYWEDTMTYSLDREEYGRIDLRFQDYAALSMTYVENNGKPGLVIADSMGGATLYYVDISGETPVANKIGKLPGVNSITTLFSDVIAPTNDNPVNTEGDGTQNVLPGAEGTPEPETAPETEQIQEAYPGGACQVTAEVDAFETAAPAASPRTGAVAPQAVSAIQANEAGLTKETTSYVVKPVSATGSAAASVSGLVTIRFDAKKMTLESFQTAASCVSVVDDRDNGVLTIAYADLDPVDRIVTLNFTGNCGANGEITVEHRQVNEETVSYTQTIGVSHSFGAWKVTKAPTATEPGTETRTCSVCGADEHRALPAVDPNCPSKAFKDLDTTAWYHEYVDYVLSKNIMVGNGNGTFGPNNNVTRAQMVTLLYGLAGRPAVDSSKSLPFTDVSGDAWYAGALRWAYQNGIAAGTSATTFTPNANVSREQMVSFLARYAKLAGKYEKASADLGKFTDGGSVSSYATESMEWAIANGLVSGTGNGKLDPKATATRAQIAVVITKYCQKLGE